MSNSSRAIKLTVPSIFTGGGSYNESFDTKFMVEKSKELDEFKSKLPELPSEMEYKEDISWQYDCVLDEWIITTRFIPQPKRGTRLNPFAPEDD